VPHKTGYLQMPSIDKHMSRAY